MTLFRLRVVVSFLSRGSVVVVIAAGALAGFVVQARTDGGVRREMIPGTALADIGAHRNESISTHRDVARDKTPDGLSASDWSGIRDAYERHRHEVVAVANEEGVWRARNPGQQWLTRFDRDGFLVEPEGGGWTWGLVLTSYGTDDMLRAVDTSAPPNVEGERVTYGRGDELDEWFINDRRGLEHGFTLHARPPGGRGALIFDLTVRGELKPHVQSDGRGVTFAAGDSTSVLNYTGLQVVDADGRVLPARFERRSEERIRLRFTDRDARYPVTIDPIAQQQAYLKASNTDARTNPFGDAFGGSVAISGDTVVIGAGGEDSSATGVDGDQTNNSAPNSGAAYVFVRSGGVWSQEAYLKASNTEAGDGFGSSVAIYRDTVVVAARYEDSNATGVDGGQTNDSAPDSGAAYVFVRSGTTWGQQAYLKASNTGAGDGFSGLKVAVSEDTVVVGVQGEGSNATGVDGDQSNNSASQSGAAYVFVRSGGTWSQQAYLKASNTDATDLFGQFVATSGDTVVVGAPFESSNATGVDGDQTNNSALLAGAAYVFTVASSDFDPSTFYEIVSRNSDKCLDVSYASTEAAASVIQWICHGGANQQWLLKPVSDGAFRIIARHSGQVLDVYGGLVDDVAPIIQFPWHGGDNQLWTLEPAANGYMFIVARHSGKVLDVEGGSADDGSRVIQYTRHGGANQQWLLHAVAPTADSITTVGDREP